MGFLDTDTDEAVDVRMEDGPSSSSFSGLVGHIRAKFQRAEDGRYSDEQRWLKAYKNYRGLSDSQNPDQLRDSERSRVFIKITKVKVLAAAGQIKSFPL